MGAREFESELAGAGGGGEGGSLFGTQEYLLNGIA